MKNRTTITEKQKLQFNRMFNTLKRIAACESPAKLRKDSEKEWGLDFEEAIETSYENIQAEAANACKNVRPFTIDIISSKQNKHEDIHCK